MRRRLSVQLLALGAVAGLGSGCSRSFSPAQPIQPGTLFGQVVYAQAGSSIDQPAPGASVTLAGTSLGTVAGATGQFVLSGITQSSGDVVFRFASTPGQPPDKERLTRLQDVGAGPGRQVGVGTVELGDLATVHGQVEVGGGQGDGGAALSGLGTTTFVPNSPFQPAESRPDGTFVLSDLPPGEITVDVYHSGYLPQAFQLTLQPGEDLALATIVLVPAPGTQSPGSISGQLSLVPAGSFTQASVEAAPVGSASASGFPGVVDAQGNFTVGAVTAGLYTVTASVPGYASATAFNVLVQPGDDNAVPTLTLGTESDSVDAGVDPDQYLDAGPALVDAGSEADAGAALDAGSGTDAGLAPDAGPADAGPADGGVVDAGNPDAGAGDAGIPDSGTAALEACVVKPLDAVGPGARETLDASCSTGESPLVYSWTQTRGGPVTLSLNNSALASRPTFVAPASPQALGFTLTVTDPLGNTRSTSLEVDVIEPPVARVTPAQSVLYPDAGLSLDGTGSYDPSGLSLSFHWSVASGAISLVADGGFAQVFGQGSTDGGVIGSVELVVVDPYLSSAPFPVTLLAPGVATAPSLTVGPTQVVSANSLVTLTGLASSADPHDTFTYSWSQTGGPPVSLLSPGNAQCDFLAPSVASGSVELAFLLTVTDTGGLQAFGTVNVVVTSQLNANPPQVIGTDPVAGGPGSPFYATVFFSEGIDVQSLGGRNLEVIGPDGGAVGATISYDGVLNAATLQFNAPLTPSASYVLEAQGVLDQSGNPLPTPFSLGYTARSPLWTLDGEGDGGYLNALASSRPQVIRGASGDVVLAGQGPGACGYSAILVSFELEGSSLVDEDNALCLSGTTDDVSPRALRVGANIWAALGWTNTTMTLFLREGNNWVRRGTGLTQSMITDGTTLYIPSSPLSLGRFSTTDSTPEAPVTIVADAGGDLSTTYGGDGDGARFFVAWVNGQGTPQVATRLFSQTSTGFPEVGRVGGGSVDGGATGADQIGVPRLRVMPGVAPVVIQAEQVGVSWQAYAYQGLDDGAGSLQWVQLGGGAAGPSVDSHVDGVVFGHTLYVVFASGGEVFMRRVNLDDPSAVWVSVYGPNGDGSFNASLACSADHPTADVAPDGIWVGWSEGCGSPTLYSTWARELQ